MKLFRRKTQPNPFPPDRYEPVLRRSICTGETTAGFRNKETGRFEEVMLIRSEKDLEDFKRQYLVADVRTEY